MGKIFFSGFSDKYFSLKRENNFDFSFASVDYDFNAQPGFFGNR